MADPVGFDLRRDAGFLVLLVLAAAVYFPWTWSAELGSLGGDSAVYMLSARHYAPYLPHDDPAAQIAAGSQFPPLYPVLLAATGAAADPRLAHAVTTLALLAAFAALYVWAVIADLGRARAAALTAVFALMPGTYLQALQLHSESLYLALSLASLAALAEGLKQRSAALFWCGAALIAAATLTRTAGVALWPALGVALWRGRPQRAPWMMVLAVAPTLVWAAWHRADHGYVGDLWRHYATGGTRELLTRVLNDWDAPVWGWAENWLQTVTSHGVILAGGGLALAAMLARFARREPDAWYAAAYGAMLLIWPYPGESPRFVWVIVPVLLVQLIWAVLALVERVARRQPILTKAASWTLVAILLTVVAPAVLSAVERYGHRWTEEEPALRHLPEWYGPNLYDANLDARRHLALARAVAELVPQVPAGECVFSIKPAITVYYGDRSSVAPPPESLDDAAFEQALRAAGCRYFLLLPFGSATFPTSYYYPERRLAGRLVALDNRKIVIEDGQQAYALLAVEPQER